jgi:HK97 family phage major capsid protein
MRNKNSYDVQNALRIGEKEEGGYLVPDEFEQRIIEALQEENIFRTLANVIQTSHGERKIPVVASHGTAAWVDENEEIPEGDDKFGIVTLGAHKLATLIKVSEELLQDSVFNLESYIAKEFARRIGRAEEEAFITGNGTGRPTGILTSGEAVTTAGAAITADEVIDFYHSLKEPYRKTAVFITNDQTVKTLRKLKDANGQYIWQPGLQSGTPDTILGKPFKTSVYMPNIASDAKVLAFGDFSYYWVADRQGRAFQRLNELFAVTGQVGFKATQRVDGKLTLPEAVKVLKIKE